MDLIKGIAGFVNQGKQNFTLVTFQNGRGLKAKLKSLPQNVLTHFDHYYRSHLLLFCLC